MQKIACFMFFFSLILTCSVNSSKLRNKKQFNQQVVNGNFDQGQDNWKTNDFEIDGRKGYNSNFEGDNQNKAVELDAWKGNSDIEQQFDLVAGTYTLRFEAAAREGWDLETSKLRVEFNNEVVLDYTPENLKVKKFKLTVTAKAGINTLKFSAQGASDGVGIVVDTISLKGKDLEFIVDGGFENGGDSWKSDDKEIQKSELYIASWNSGNVAELDAWKGNTNMKQTFKLTGPTTLIVALQYNARPDYALDSNIGSIYLNGQLILKIEPSDYNLHSAKVYANGIVGENTIEFKGEGKDDGVGLLIDNVSVKSYAPEKIINGGFENDTKGWTGSGKIEIGDGSYYNDNFKPESKKAAELDAWENISLSQVFEANDDDTYYIAFDGAARKGVDLSSNQCIVSFNDKQVDEIKPKDYSLRHFIYYVDVKEGKNELKITGSGTNDTVGFVIDNVSSRKKHEANGPNLIENGTFDDKGKGWVSNDLEVEDGKIYNNEMDTGSAVELDSHSNVDVSTTFKVEIEGYYELQFDGAARENFALESNKASVSIDQERIIKIEPNDYKKHKFVYPLYLDKGDHTLTFTGEGTDDTVGYIVDNVSVKLLFSINK